jgi:hypothetical protein
MDSQTPTGRILAPKPQPVGPTGAVRTSFPSASPTTAISPLGFPPGQQTEQRRRRGRPSKREIEERRSRHSTARASVDLGIAAVLPSPRATFGQSQYGPVAEVPPSPATSAPPTIGTAAVTPRRLSQDPSSNGSGGSSGRRRNKGRPPKNPQSPNFPPPVFTQPSSSREQTSPGRATSREPVIAGPSGQQPRPPETTGALSSNAGESEENKRTWKDHILNE